MKLDPAAARRAADAVPGIPTDDEIKRAQARGDPDDGTTYYQHWLATLERLVAEKGVASGETLARYRDAWDRAADRTPHGKPIELSPDDFA